MSHEQGALLSAVDIKVVVPVSDATLARWIKAKRFPEPIVIGGHRYWPEASVAAWVARQGAGKVE